MHKSVSDYWWDYNDDLEGVCNFPYLDIKGLLTTGVGNMIEAEYMLLPWQVNGKPASKDRILREIGLVRSRKDLCKAGGFAFSRLTAIRLAPEKVKELVATKLAWHDKVLKGRFPNWESLPADAQLGTHSIAWAAGAMFRFPIFQTCLKEEKFLRCKEEGHLKEEDNPGVIKRNLKQEVCFENAHWVKEKGLDRSKLYFPQVLTKNSDIGAICPNCGGLGRV